MSLHDHTANRDAELVAAEIPLTNGMVALVDAQDFERLSQYSWRARKGSKPGGPELYYASRRVPSAAGRGPEIHMHHDLLGPGLVDHKDGNGLNNQRSNLRHCTQSQNLANARFGSKGKTSRFRGVSFHRAKGRWQAQSKLNQKKVHLGRFVSEEEAARAYDNFAREHFGEFARLNFPDGEAT